MHQLASGDGQAPSPRHKKKKSPAYGTGTAWGWSCSALRRNTGETTEHHSNAGRTNQNSAGVVSTQEEKEENSDSALEARCPVLGTELTDRGEHSHSTREQQEY